MDIRGHLQYKAVLTQGIGKVTNVKLDGFTDIQKEMAFPTPSHGIVDLLHGTRCGSVMILDG